MEDIIGYGAAICTTLSFVPQVIQVLKTKNTRDISLLMYVIFVCGVSLWLIYGIMIFSLPIISANVITLVLAGIILIMKLREKS